MTPQRIRELLEGELKEVNMLHRKLVNKYSNARDAEALKLVGYLGLAVACMAGCYPNLDQMETFQELQTDLAKTMFKMTEEDMLVVSRTTCNMIDDRRKSEGKAPLN